MDKPKTKRRISYLWRYFGSVRLAVVCALLGLSLAGLIPRAQVQGAPSSQLNFQARLLGSSGAIVADGTYNLQFNIYNVSSGGSSLWAETYLNNAAQGVSVRSGYLNVQLGALDSLADETDINWNEELWLGMTVRGTGSCSFGACTPGDGEMTPRIKLTAVPYAFQAGSLTKTSGSDRGTLSFNGVTTNPDITLPDEGDGTLCLQNSANCGFAVGSGTAFLQGGNTVAGATDLGLDSNFDLNLVTNNSTRMTIQNDGDLAVDTNTLFVDAANNRVGVGNAAPGYTLDVTGNTRLNGFASVGNGAVPVNIAPLNVTHTFTGTNCATVGCHGILSSVTADATTGGGGALSGLWADTLTSNTAFTLDAVQGIYVTAGTRGAASTITNNYGLYVETQTKGSTDYGVYIGGADNYALYVNSGATQLNGTLGVSGNITASSLGSANTASYLCLNASSQIANCSATATGSAFVQGGNSFTGAATLGTNDNFGLSLETNNVTYYTLSNAGVLTGANGATLSVPDSGTRSERFGANTSADGVDTVALGNGATANSNQSVAIGSSATTDGNAGTWANAVAIGYNAEVTQADSVAIGSGSTADQFSISLGSGATGTGNNSIAIGHEATTATFADAVAIGQGATISGNGSKSIAIGQGATTTANNQLVIGSTTTPITNWYGGNGIVNATPSTATFQATGGEGTNIQGASTIIAGGKSTGNATGGSILFQTSDAGGSGTALRSLSTKATLLGTGNFGIGDTTPAATLTVGDGDLFQVAGASGNITTAGDLAVNGADITSTSGLTLTPAAGALTLNSTGSTNDIVLNSADIVSILDNTTITGNTSGVAATINNSTSTGNILNLQDNGTTVVAITDNGNIDVGNNVTHLAPWTFNVSQRFDSTNTGGIGCGIGCTAGLLQATADNPGNNGTAQGLRGLTVSANTSATSFTMTNVMGLYVDPGSKGAGSTITNNYGISVGAQIKGDNNAGIVISETTGTKQVNLLLGGSDFTSVPSAGAYSLFSQSTDQSYFAGSLGIGDSTPLYALTVGSGDVFGVNSSGAITAATGITSSGTITFSGLNCSTAANGGTVTTNGSGTLSCADDDAAGGAGTFLNGGNNFGGNATLGTTGAGQSLTLLTANVARLTITSAGAATFSGDLTVSGTSNFGITNVTGTLTVGTSDTTGTLLVLDTKTGSGNPTGTNGGLYYNSNDHEFRAHKNSKWGNLRSEEYAYLSADRTNLTTSFADVTDLSFSVAASTNYEMECAIVYQTGNTGTGSIGYSLNGPASPNHVSGMFVSTQSNSTGGTGSMNFNTYDGGGITGSVAAANADVYGIFKAYFRNGANAGTLQLRFKSETVAVTVTTKANSYCTLTEL